MAINALNIYNNSPLKLNSASALNLISSGQTGDERSDKQKSSQSNTRNIIDIVDTHTQSLEQRKLTTWLLSHGMSQSDFDGLNHLEKLKILQEVRRDTREETNDTSLAGSESLIDILV